MKNSIFCIALVLVLSLFILGCDDNNNNGNEPTALTENDFANNPGLRADPEKGVIVNFLEHPDSEKPELDTGDAGIDTIPVRYTRTIEHTYCWEDDNPGAMHFAELRDSQGNLILTFEANAECATAVITQGDYIVRLHHDGITEEDISVFLQVVESANETATNTIDTDQGKFGTLKRLFSRTLGNIGIVETAMAQTVEENVHTLVMTGSCVGCDLHGAYLFNVHLRGANLHGADLSEAVLAFAILQGTNLTNANLTNANLTNADLNVADLSMATLTGADLSDADLSGADLSDAILSGADLSMANLHGADLSGADLSGADLSTAILISAFLRRADLGHANLTGAVLVAADLGHVDLSDATLIGADLGAAILTGADLSDADLSGADLFLVDLTNASLNNTNLSSATWCNGCKCNDNSIGTCNGCPPVEQVCTGLQ